MDEVEFGSATHVAVRRRPYAGPRTDAALTGVILVVGASLPSLVGAGQLSTLIAGSFAMYLAYSWNIVGGILGELSLVHMVFWAIGGYSLVLAFSHRQSWELWIGVAVVVAAAGAVVTVSVATWLRLVGLYLAVFTLILHEIARSVVGEIGYLGKGLGLYVAGSHFWSQKTTYYVGFGLVVMAALVNYVVLARPVGLRWLTLRDDPIAAESIGINPTREKAAAYALSAALAVIGGAFQAYYFGYVQPDATLNLSALIAAILAVYVGGPGTMWGPFTGVMIVFGIGQVAAAYSTSANVALYAQLLQYFASFLVIRFVTSRLTSRDLLTAVAERALDVLPSKRREAVVNVPRTDSRTTVRPAPRHRASVPPSVAPERHSVLGVQAVTKDFGGLHVLGGISYKLMPGTITALVGPNGAGKTTLCNIMSGFERATSGGVELAGEDVSSLPPYARFRRGIGRTFQTPRLCDRLSLLQNVAAASGGDVEAARHVLRRVGVMDETQLAGSSDLYERRLTEIARAVAGAQLVVLFDEPLVGLAHDQQQATLGILRELADSGSAILIVEHLIPVVAPAADRMLVLVGGKLIADTTPAAALAQPDVIEAYLGEPIELELPT